MYKKYWIIIIPSIIVILQTFLGILPKGFDSWENFWKYLNSDLFRYYLVIFIFVSFIFVIYQLLYLRRPIKRFQKVEIFTIERLNEFCDELSNIYSQQLGINLRINVMRLKRQVIFLHKKFPFIKLFRKVLIIEYPLKNMDHDTDKNVIFSINQGVCGKAVQEGTVYADLSKVHPSAYNLDKNQIEMTKDLKFIMSTPVFEYDLETRRIGKKIIGVVNFDTKSHIIVQLLQQAKNDVIEDFTRRIRETSLLFSKLN